MPKKIAPIPEPEDKLAPGRHMGLRCGYEVMTDGAIRLAPMFSDQMRSIMEREAGLRETLTTIGDFVSRELARTSKERSVWWRNVAEDLGIDIGGGWMFHTTEGALRQPEPPKADPE